ncbi:MAG: YbhN family protein [Anaerolineaceae bacterium]
MYPSKNSIYHQLLPGTILGIIVLFGLMILGDVNLVSFQFLHFQWKYFAAALIFSLINYFFRFLKRHFCLKMGNNQNLTFGQSFRLFTAGFPLAITPMKVGESFKGIWLNRISGLPVEKAVSVFLVDHISDGLSIFVVLSFGTIAYPELWPYFLLILALFLVALFFMQMKPMLQGIFNLSEKLPFLEKGVPALRECLDGNPELLRFWPLILSSLLGVISWLANGAALVVILMGLGYPFSWFLVGASVLVFAFAMLMGILSSFPSGVGVVDVAMAALLTLVLGFRPEIAAAATILFRLATFWFGFLVGLLIWSISGKSLGILSGEGRVIES